MTSDPIPTIRLNNDEVWEAVLPKLEAAVKKGQFILAPGSRIALPANTFFADLEAVVQAGFVPVVVDHD